MRSKKILMATLLLVPTLMFVGCANKGEVKQPTTSSSEIVTEVEKNEEKSEVNENVNEEIKEEVNEEVSSSETNVSETKNVIKPLESFGDLKNLRDFTANVLVTKESFIEEFDKDEKYYYLNFKVFDYDKYDLVDISTLEVGSIIELRGQEVEVESLERTEGGLLLINGGLENEGYDLFTDETGVFFESLENDYKFFREVGDETLELSLDFVLIDNADLDNMGKTYTIKDLMKEDCEFDFFLNEHNTTILVVNNRVVEMVRHYIP